MNGCLEILKESDIGDVDVEYRESIYTRSVGPNLHPTFDVRGHLTLALGLFIASTSH